MMNDGAARMCRRVLVIPTSHESKVVELNLITSVFILRKNLFYNIINVVVLCQCAALFKCNALGVALPRSRWTAQRVLTILEQDQVQVCVEMKLSNRCWCTSSLILSNEWNFPTNMTSNLAFLKPISHLNLNNCKRKSCVSLFLQKINIPQRRCLIW